MSGSNAKRLIGAALALVMLLACAACGSTSGGSAATAAPAGTAAPSAGTQKTELNIRIPDGFSTLDPDNWTLDSDCRMCYQIYETLYALADDNSEVPVLATGYTVSDDGLTYVFTLRDGVTFSNGDKLTATDAAYSIERAKSSAYLSSNVSTVDTAVADDAAGTVTVTLTTPTPGLISGLSYIMIVDKAYTEANKDANGLLGFNACGTGPYMLKDYTQDVSVTLEANPNYWGEAPSIQTLNFLLIVDENTALSAFEAGELDLSRFATPGWTQLKADTNYNTAELTTNHVTYLILNTQKAPFDNEQVRQAIACALNRDDIITMAMDGLATPTYTVVTPLMVGYAEIEPQFTYDTARAKELLTQAGYPDGLDIGEIATLSGTYFDDVAQVVQQQLADAGITATVTGYETNTMISNCLGGNFGMAVMGQTDTYDMSWLATYYNSAYIGAMNMARYSDPEMDDLLNQAGVCMDPDARIALYKTILEKADTVCAYLPLFNKIQCIGWAKGLSYVPSVRLERYADCSWS